MFRKISLYGLALLSLVLTGCASFPGDKLAIVSDLPDKSTFKSRPSVYIEPKMFVGRLTDAQPPAQNAPGTQKFKEIVEKITKGSTLFSSYTMDEFQAKQADYTIKMSLQNYGDQGTAAISGFIAGFTFGIIPGAATDNYRLTVEVRDRKGQMVKSFDLDDSVTTWIGIWFIPVMGKTPESVVTKVWENMVRTAYKSLLDDKILQYAGRPRYDMELSRFGAPSAFVN